MIFGKTIYKDILNLVILCTVLLLSILFFYRRKMFPIRDRLWIISLFSSCVILVRPLYFLLLSQYNFSCGVESFLDGLTFGTYFCLSIYQYLILITQHRRQQELLSLRPLKKEISEAPIFLPLKFLIERNCIGKCSLYLSLFMLLLNVIFSLTPLAGAARSDYSSNCPIRIGQGIGFFSAIAGGVVAFFGWKIFREIDDVFYIRKELSWLGRVVIFNAVLAFFGLIIFPYIIY